MVNSKSKLTELVELYVEEDGGTENTAVEAMEFKELWSKSMTDESRKNVFKHLKLLCMLAEKCN